RLCPSRADVFFFQAEDGIRDFHVTGVQTCALPISSSRLLTTLTPPALPRPPACTCALTTQTLPPSFSAAWRASSGDFATAPFGRSEERRVGKECRSRTPRDR